MNILYGVILLVYAIVLIIGAIAGYVDDGIFGLFGCALTVTAVYALFLFVIGIIEHAISLIITG